MTQELTKTDASSAARCYAVVNARNLRSLEAIVALKMRDGWVPVGGVFGQECPLSNEPIWIIAEDGKSLKCSVAEIPSNTKWCQAMMTI